MRYPKRLMGWVRGGNTPYEIRLNHEPSLFCHNRYVVYQISKLKALPSRIMFDANSCPAVMSVHYGKIHFWGSYFLSRGSEVIVEPNGIGFRISDERVRGSLRLWSIPDNIR